MKFRVCTFAALALLLLPANLSASAGDWNLYRAAGHRDEAWDRVVRDGLTAIDANPRIAGEFLSRAYSLGCRDGLVLYNWALILELDGSYAEAIRIYRQAKADLALRYPKHFSNRQALENLGRVYFLTGQYDLAIEVYRRAYARSFRDKRSHYLFGRALAQKGRLTEALRQLKAYSKVRPHDPDSRLAIALLYYRQGNPAQAKHWVQRALESRRDHPGALRLWAVLKQEEKQARDQVFNREMQEFLGIR